MFDGIRNEVNTLLTHYFARRNDYVDTKDGRDALAREVPILVNERLDVIETETNLKKPEGHASTQVLEQKMQQDKFVSRY